MNSAQIFEVLENTDLPVRILGTGNVTHCFVGKLVGAKGEATEVVCLFAEPRVKASAEFEQKLKSEGCRCGKQKLPNFPLCGLCFSNLKKGIQTALRQNKGAELEETYNLAVDYLTGRKR
jgi:hypothetical protein